MAHGHPVAEGCGRNGFIHLKDQGATVVGHRRLPTRGTPTRLLDTRTGLGAPAAKVAGGHVDALQVSGQAGIPSGGVGTAWST